MSGRRVRDGLAGTVNEDLGEKFWKYEELGVREYFLFDPEAVHLVPVLQGFRLSGTSYRRIIPLNDEIESELGFRLRMEGTMLRLLDARTGGPIPTRAEAVEAEREPGRHGEAAPMHWSPKWNG